MTRSSLAALAAVLAVATSLGMTAPAQEDPDARPITLAECIRRALSNNYGYEASRLGARSASTALPIAQAAFDPILRSNGRYTDATTPTASSLEGVAGGGGADVFVGNLGPGFPTTIRAGAAAAVPKRQSYHWDVSLSKRFDTGAEAAVSFAFDRLKTNQFFATINPSLTTSARLTLSQPILRGGWFAFNLADVRQAENDVAIAKEQVRASAETLVFDVQTAYWDLVYALQDLEVKRDNLELAKRLERDNREKLKAGVSIGLDVTQAQLQVQNRMTEVQLAEKEVGNQRDALRQLVDPIGLQNDGLTSPWLPVDRPEPVAEVELPPLGSVLETAFENRADWREARRRYENARLEEDKTRNELLPRLDLDGSLQYSGVGDNFSDPFDDTIKREFDTWAIGFGFEFPLGNRAARANHLRASLDRRRERATLEELRATIHQQVRAALRETKTALATIEQTREAVRLAVEQLRGEQARFEVGQSTSYRVLEIQADLAAARSNSRRALLDYQISLAQLEREQGRLLAHYGLLEREATP